MDQLLAHKNQSLADHLAGVAERASLFAAAFGAAPYGVLAGQLHDLGKAEAEFQKRIRSDDKEGKKQPHAPHGAAIALSHEPPAWPVALAINGHHAGLHNRGDVDLKRSQYLRRAELSLDALMECDPAWSGPVFPEALPEWLARLPFDVRKTSEGWFAIDLFTRFLFSALIDADRLDTEENEQGREASVALRTWPRFEPDQLLRVLCAELDRRAERAAREKTASEAVRAVWNEVGRLCREAARCKRGLFTLAVPTGGGKTLASLLFALAHAVCNAAAGIAPFRRIIVVIPYLNIIQQTAKDLKAIFGEKWILEHHSQADEAETRKFKKERDDGAVNALAARRRLGAENWDAPIIVTTSAQFFGSLFSRKPSAARKLHNICQSVVIFDEVQTLPPLLLRPLLSVLGELADPERPYGCSLVFCTATQPALNRSDDLPCGLTGVTPIVPPAIAAEHFRKLSRVDYSWPQDDEGLTWEELASQIVLLRPQQALAVVNTRQAARELHAAIAAKLGPPPDGLFQLSTWMTPAHRLEVLDEVRRRLSPDNVKGARQRCLLVSTQCIEAGVDVDFPHAWREFAPYDAIVQAAGRCNRSGRLPVLRDDPGKGKVRVFRSADACLPDQLYKTAVSQTELLRRMGAASPEDPASFEQYFRLLYQLSVPEDCVVQRERARLHFENVHDLFRFIDDETFSVLIPEDAEAKAVYERAERRGFFVREDWRALQPYIINLPRHSTQRSPYRENLMPSFDPDCGLYLWYGGYSGGTGGVGITFDGLSPEDYAQ